jgi:hypothetical protein
MTPAALSNASADCAFWLAEAVRSICQLKCTMMFMFLQAVKCMVRCIRKGGGSARTCTPVLA